MARLALAVWALGGAIKLVDLGLVGLARSLQRLRARLSGEVFLAGSSGVFLGSLKLAGPVVPPGKLAEHAPIRERVR